VAIQPGDAVDLDHADDGVTYRGWSHSSCNRRAGARRGQELRRQRERTKMQREQWTEQAIAAEISTDRTHTSIVAAGRVDGVVVFELLQYADGTDTAHLVTAAAAERTTVAVVVDPRSPGATLIEPLKAQGLRIVEPSAHDVAVAHGQLVDELRAGRLRFVGHPALTAAAQHAMGRPLAGGEAVERRKVDVDTGPIVAAELAVWGLMRAPRAAPPPLLWAALTDDAGNVDVITARPDGSVSVKSSRSTDGVVRFPDGSYGVTSGGDL
jgi:hypothetical protein